jgi:hypothetical protein
MTYVDKLNLFYLTSLQLMRDQHITDSTMRHAVAVLVTAGATVLATSARADWSVGAGFESFRWKETTTPAVKESGLRWALDLTWAQSQQPGLSAGYNLKLYTGNVDYTGAQLFTGIPASEDTHYRGMINEFQAIYRMPQSAAAIVLAAGWDRWNRKINSVTEEDWDVLYAKLGATVNTAVKQGFIGSAGVKYPVWARENANFMGMGALANPRLRPGKDLSFYATAGYRVNPSWDVYAYYDGYRFKESNTVAVPFAGATGFFVQPESRQDVIGMKVQHNFQ